MCCQTNCCGATDRKTESLLLETSHALHHSVTNEVTGIYVSDQGGKLYAMDPQTGAVQLIGNMGLTMYDLASLNGTLYGLTAGGMLYEIDPLTAQISLLGSTAGGCNALAGAPNGKLYAAGGSSLYTIDPVSLQVSLVGQFGPGYYSSGDLSFDAAGRCYLTTTVGEVAELDPANATIIQTWKIPDGWAWGIGHLDGKLYYAEGDGEVGIYDLATSTNTKLARHKISFYGMAVVLAGKGCKDPEVPILTPRVELKWGDSLKDNLETDDLERCTLRVCNPYKGVSFCNVRLYNLRFVDQKGKDVPRLPNGEPAAWVSPAHLLEFGDLGPCSDKADACHIRELVIKTSGLKEGRYKLLFDYCFDVKYCQSGQSGMELELIAS